MSRPLEHDYIFLTEHSLSQLPSVKVSSSSSLVENNEKSNADNFRETELRLGLPGLDLESTDKKCKQLCNFVSKGKRGFSDTLCGSNKWDLASFEVEENGDSKNGKMVVVSSQEKEENGNSSNDHVNAHASKTQVVGWPPIRSFRKNTLAANLSKSNDVEGDNEKPGCLYVKVSMDGAPFLRKVDLKHYDNYTELSSALEKMFSCFTIGQCSSPNVPGHGRLSKSHLTDLLNGSEYVLTYEDKDSDWMLVGDVPWRMFLDSCKKLRIVRSTDAIGLAPRALQSKNKS